MSSFGNKYFYKIVYLTVCLLVVLGFSYGYIYTTGKIKSEQLTQIGSYEGNSSTINYNDISADAINTNEISPSAMLIQKIYYSKCGQTIEESMKVPEDIAKLSQEQFREAYKDWNIEKINPTEIIISKTVDAKCSEHYIVKVKNEKVAVYYQEPVNGVGLKELTNIPISSLSKADQENLKLGIKIESNEKLAELLEDFGS